VTDSNRQCAVAQVVKRHFRPEFLNRLDDVVVFEPLGADHLRKIARLQARPRGTPAPVTQDLGSHSCHAHTPLLRD